MFVRYGWRASAALSMGWYGWQLLILLLRGPHCRRYTWFGYEGGVAGRKPVVESGEKSQDVVERALGPDGDTKFDAEK